MIINNSQDLEALKVIGKIVATTLRKMIRATEPGMTTRELDNIGKTILDFYGARSAPKYSYNFPGYTCISINEQAAHGIPCDRMIQAGDIVNIDVSAEKNGYFSDTGGSFVVPPSSSLKDKLIASTQLALNQACQSARAGRPLNHIGRSIEKVAKQANFKIIRNLCSHGVGRSLHEDPKDIPAFYNPHDERTLPKGLVITIEPFLSTKSRIATMADDGWTLVGDRDNLSAQFEHSMVITERKPILLTLA